MDRGVLLAKVLCHKALQVLFEAGVLCMGQVQAIPDVPQEVHVLLATRIKLICLWYGKYKHQDFGTTGLGQTKKRNQQTWTFSSLPEHEPGYSMDSIGNFKKSKTDQK